MVGDLTVSSMSVILGSTSPRIIFHSAKKATYFDQRRAGWRENCSLHPAVAWRGLTEIIPLCVSFLQLFFSLSAAPLSPLSPAFIYLFILV